MEGATMRASCSANVSVEVCLEGEVRAFQGQTFSTPCSPSCPTFIATAAAAGPSPGHPVPLAMHYIRHLHNHNHQLKHAVGPFSQGLILPTDLVGELLA